MNPVPSLAIARAAIGLTGTVSRIAGTAAGELIGGASASFKDIFSQPPATTATAPPLDESPAGQLQRIQAELLSAVRSALGAAGIDLSQKAPLELSVAGDGRVRLTDAQPGQFNVETVLNHDPGVVKAASQLLAFRSAHALQPQPLRVDVQP